MSQRCNKNVRFLMQWCIANKISANWFFTETSQLTG